MTGWEAKLRLPLRFRVTGDSMSPTLRAGDSLLVDRRAYHRGMPSPGDIVLVRKPGQSDYFMTKRIIGLPGEAVVLSKGTLSIDGATVGEPYVQETGPDEASWTLGENEYVVLGDNRGGSTDSRSFGPIRNEHIIGRIFYRYLPPHSRGRVRRSKRAIESTHGDP